MRQFGRGSARRIDRLNAYLTKHAPRYVEFYGVAGTRDLGNKVASDFGCQSPNSNWVVGPHIIGTSPSFLTRSAVHLLAIGCFFVQMASFIEQ